MEEKKQQEISAGKKILFLVIITFAFFFLIEGLLSIYFYQQSGGEKIASLEAIKTIIKKMEAQDNSFVYEPWVEFRNKIVRSSETQSGEPTRRSAPDFYSSKIPGDTMDIYFFGGSTTFGENVPDSATIPSQFVKLYREVFKQGRSVRVHNYGSSHYYSYQELILLANLVQMGHQPDILIYLDGINDFRFSIPSYHRQSYFSYIFRQFFNSGLRSKGGIAFLDTVHALSKTPEFVPQMEFSNSLVNNYIDNMKNIGLLAGMINAKAYFFCEPSPYYKAGNLLKTDANAMDVFSRFDYIYPHLQQMQDSIPGFTFLGDVAEQKDFLLPGGTYTPLLNRKVAEKILAELMVNPPLQ